MNLNAMNASGHLAVAAQMIAMLGYSAPSEHSKIFTSMTRAVERAADRVGELN